MLPRWIALVCLMLLPWRAAAQPPSSFRDLAGRLEPGDRVVVDTGGPEAPVTGDVVTVAPGSLTVRVPRDGDRTFTAAEVRRIVREGDSLSNGFRWGLAIGAVMGCVAATAFVDGGTARNCPAGAIILGAPFVGIAVLIDAAHVGSTEVFRAAPAAASGRSRIPGVMAGIAVHW